MKKSKYNILKTVQLIVAIIAIIMCGLCEIDYSYKNMIWVPVFFLLSIILLKNKKNYDFSNVAIVTIDVLATLKYCIIPILMIIYDDFGSGVLTGHIPRKYYIDRAIILQIIEIITIYLIFFLYKKKSIEETQVKVHKIGKVIIAFCIIGLLVAIIYWENFIPSQFFIINNDYISNKSVESDFDGAISIILNVFKIILLIIGIQFFYKKYQKNNLMRYVIGAGVVLLVYIALSTGMSRWAIVIPFLTCVFLFLKMFGEKAKLMIVVIVLIVVISVISITFVKFNWLLDDKSSFNDLIRVYAMQMQEYFSGIRATAQGIETVDRYGDQITYKTMFNDFAGSIPVVSHYIDQKDRINIYYNYICATTEPVFS